MPDPRKIVAEFEVKRHNGQCPYGEWIPLAEAPHDLREDVVCQVLETDDDYGEAEVGGQKWVFRRVNDREEVTMPEKKISGTFAMHCDGSDPEVVRLVDGRVVERYQSNLLDTFNAARDPRADAIEAISGEARMEAMDADEQAELAAIVCPDYSLECVVFARIVD